MIKGMVFGDRYKLEDFIGQGGMSLVYRAIDTRTGHSVAIKILKSEYNNDKEFVERFQREAQAASLMSHHNIVNLLDVGVEGEYRYLVLEYVSGNTLKEIIRQKGRLNTATAIQITIRILSALQHAHENGIIHRDIKPQNILINSEGHVKVADFGIARMTNAFTINKGETVVGSVHYSSPEQAMGNVVEASSDLYSTGVVMYEMLTGRVPFVGDSPISVAMQHINNAPPPIINFAPETPPAVVAVVMKALEKDPKNRYQSARDMAEALIKARDQKPDAAEVGTPPANTAFDQTAKPAQDTGRRNSSVHPNKNRGSGKQRALKTKTLWLTALVVMVVLAGLTLGIVAVYNRIAKSAVAPDVIGQLVSDGMVLARREGLNWQQIDINSDTIPAGVVISQIPEPDTQMEKGDSLLATVSLGPVNTVMLDVIGKNYEDATARLNERGYNNIVVIKSVSTEPIGLVLQQNPQGGQTCVAGQNVELTISGGSTMVPNLVGVAQNEAVEQLQANNLTAGTPVYTEVMDQEQVGRVMAQSPAAGTLAVIDAPVALTVAVASLRYLGEVSIAPPSSENARRLRVSLVINDTEIVKYEGTIAAGTVSTILIPLSSDVEGDIKCRAYLDDVLYEEKIVSFK